MSLQEKNPHASPTPGEPPCRIGHGYDLHRLSLLTPPAGATTLRSAQPREQARPTQPVRPFVLGGVRIPADVGVVAHSDGDVLLHALADALLGAVGEPDIGQLYPDSDAQHDAMDSGVILRDAIARVRRAGYEVANIDATIVLERPKFSPHKDVVRASVAAILGVDAARVNIKAKTHEGLDALGQGLGVEVHAVALLTYKGIT